MHMFTCTAPSPTPWCSSYRKGSLRVTLDYGRQLYSSWPTMVEGDLKVPLSIATTLRCRRACYSFPRIFLLTPDPYLIRLRVK